MTATAAVIPTVVLTEVEKAVFARVVKVVAETFDIKEDEVTIDSDFSETPGVDSLGIVDLQFAIEEEFEMDFEEVDPFTCSVGGSENEGEQIQTVRQLVTCLAAA